MNIANTFLSVIKDDEKGFRSVHILFLLENGLMKKEV